MASITSVLIASVCSEPPNSSTEDSRKFKFTRKHKNTHTHTLKNRWDLLAAAQLKTYLDQIIAAGILNLSRRFYSREINSRHVKDAIRIKLKLLITKCDQTTHYWRPLVNVAHVAALQCIGIHAMKTPKTTRNSDEK